MIIRWGGQLQNWQANTRASQYATKSILGPLSTILGGMNQSGPSGTVGDISGNGISYAPQYEFNGQRASVIPKFNF